MGVPLCCTDDFFDMRATYQVKTICGRIDACNGRMNGRCGNTVLVFEEGRDQPRAELTQRSRPTAASWGVEGSIFHLC